MSPNVLHFGAKTISYWRVDQIRRWSQHQSSKATTTTNCNASTWSRDQGTSQTGWRRQFWNISPEITALCRGFRNWLSFQKKKGCVIQDPVNAWYKVQSKLQINTGDEKPIAVRLTCDLRVLNKEVRRTRFPSKTIEYMLYLVNEAKIYFFQNYTKHNQF